MADTKDIQLFGELRLPFNHSYIEGEIYPPFIKQHNIDNTKSMKMRESDVVIATFPKSGTTWAQKIVHTLHTVHKTGHLQEDKIITELIPWIECKSKADLEEMESPRYFKTHNSYKFVAYNPNVHCKYIYIARNSKDVCVSLFHHTKGFKGKKYDGDFAEFSELFLQGKVESSDWWVHVKDYYKNSRDMDILFLKYEDMHRNGTEAVRKINDFCGLPPLTDEMTSEVVQKCSFSQMKDDGKSNYSWTSKGRKEDAPLFMRKGTVGDWVNYFTPEMSEKFDAKSRDMFAGLDLKFADNL